MLDLGALRFRVIADTSAFNQQMDQVGQTLGKVGKNLTAKVTLPLFALGTACAKIGKDFDAEMSKVAAISGAVGDDLDALRDKAKEMGASTKFSATESAQAMEYMAMAGWKTEDMLEGISGIMALAAASGEDLALTSDIVTDGLTAFGLQASDSAHFADVLAAASSNANTNVSMLGESFKYVAPLAGAMNYSIEDTSVALGLMAGSGIKAGMAGTSLKTALANMVSPTDKMAGVMERYGISLTDASGEMYSLGAVIEQLRTQLGGLSEAEQTAAASTLFGKESMAGMLAIINASEADYQKLTSAIAECDGASAQMAATMQDNLEGDLTILKSQLEGIAIDLSELLMPAMRQGVQLLSKAATSFANLSPQVKKAIVAVAGIAAAIGPLLLVLGKVILAATNFGVVVSNVFSPVSLLLAAAVAAIVAFAAAWEQNLGGIRDSTQEAVGTVLATFQEHLPEMQALFSDVWAFCQQIWQEVGAPVFALIGEAVQLAGELFAAVFPAVLKVVQVAFGGIKTVWNAILKPVFDLLMSFVQKCLATVREKMPQIQSIFDKVFRAVETLWETVLKPVLEFFGDKVSWLVDFISPLLETLRKAFDFCFGWIVNLIEDAMDALDRFLDKFRSTKEETGMGGGEADYSSYGGDEYFADGGILTKPTWFGMVGSRRAIGGEAGHEAVIPLERLPEIVRQLGLDGAGSVVVNNYSPKALSAAETARLYRKSMRDLSLRPV